MRNITRQEAIKEVGLESVVKVEGETVDFSCRVTDGTTYQGYTEFSATVKVDSEDWDELTMYVYVDTHEVDAADDLDQIDWETAVQDADYALF